MNVAGHKNICNAVSLQKRFVTFIDNRTDCARTLPWAKCDSLFCSIVGTKPAVTTRVDSKISLSLIKNA